MHQGTQRQQTSINIPYQVPVPVLSARRVKEYKAEVFIVATSGVGMRGSDGQSVAIGFVD
ncbi:MAG: hypothetical protein PUP91_25715 [Rhizonema sp. PD37]|nr:hypothetical protein [Rhizonema sp. PD37]